MEPKYSNQLALDEAYARLYEEEAKQKAEEARKKTEELAKQRAAELSSKGKEWGIINKQYDDDMALIDAQIKAKQEELDRVLSRQTELANRMKQPKISDAALSDYVLTGNTSMIDREYNAGVNWNTARMNAEANRNNALLNADTNWNIAVMNAANSKALNEASTRQANEARKAEAWTTLQKLKHDRDMAKQNGYDTFEYDNDIALMYKKYPEFRSGVDTPKKDDYDPSKNVKNILAKYEDTSSLTTIDDISNAIAELSKFKDNTDAITKVAELEKLLKNKKAAAAYAKTLRQEIENWKKSTSGISNWLTNNGYVKLKADNVEELKNKKTGKIVAKRNIPKSDEPKPDGSKPVEPKPNEPKSVEPNPKGSKPNGSKPKGSKPNELKSVKPNPDGTFTDPGTGTNWTRT